MIRPYKETDLVKVLDIWYQAFVLAHPFLEDTFVEKTKKELRERYIPNSKIWVYEEKKIPIGFIAMLGNEIGGLFVMPNHHAKGIGTQLVNFIGAFHDILEVEVFKKNKIGRAFYDQYGFKTFKSYLHEDTKHDVLRMKFDKNTSD